VATTGSPFVRHLTAVLALCALSASAARAQVRGLPLYFDPTYSYETRLGVDAGNGGDLGGFVWAISASRLFYVGACPKVAVTAAGGLWHPSGEQSDGFNGGLTASTPATRALRAPIRPSAPYSAAGGRGWMDARC
jgi:hypothetical protein